MCCGWFGVRAVAERVRMSKRFGKPTGPAGSAREERVHDKAAYT